MPLVSVVIAAYHAERTIERALNSLLAQTFANWEAIVVDDASTDRTLEIAEQLSARDSRIRAFRLGRNSGPSAARNKGIKHARGEWIAVLDADDAFSPSRLENLVRVASSGEWDLLFDNLSTLETASDSVQPYWPRWHALEQKLSLAEMLRGCSGVLAQPYGVLKPFFRRSFAEMVGASYAEDLRRGEDVLFHTTMMINGARTRRVAVAGYLYEKPASQSQSNASFTNLQHSHLATQRIKRRGWGQMKLAEKLWLGIRYLNTNEPEAWVRFSNAVEKRDLRKAARAFFDSPFVAAKLLVVKPLKAFSRMYNRFVPE